MAVKKTKKTTKKSTKTKSARGGGDQDGQAKVLAEFKKLVNMTPGQIEKFLHTKDSTRVGFKKEGKGESVGHQSGRRIIEIKGTKAADLTSDDVRHMKKVVGYINRHCKQGPDHKADVKESKWRYSLMNWGHDPMKGSGCGPTN
ncbi:MAG: DNA-binding protein [Phycisphaerales bacterium]|nr:DNA-binding protein [Phycisphaerales bacterium]